MKKKKFLRFLFGIIFPLIITIVFIFLTMILYTLPSVMQVLYKIDMVSGVYELLILAVVAGLSFTLSRYLLLKTLMKRIYKDEEMGFGHKSAVL